MGSGCSKFCLPNPLKIQKNKQKNKTEVDVEKLAHLNENLKLNENFSSSEIDLLLHLREIKNYERPKGVDCPKFIQNKPVIRISSWNLNNLSADKIKNSGVLSVICLSILENNLSIIALQEVSSKEAIIAVCQELNDPKLTKTKLHNNSYQWDYIISNKALGKTYHANEFGVVIYDKSKKIEILQNSQLDLRSNIKPFTRNPFFVNIKIGSTIFLLISFHVKASDISGRGDISRQADEINDISLLAVALKHSLKSGHKVIMLGDFNQNPNSEYFDALKNQDYIYCIDSNLATNTSINHGKAYDNIWINEECKRFYTGKSGVIRDGLSHAYIPKVGMCGWGGLVSDHCPIWADFFFQL